MRKKGEIIKGYEIEFKIGNGSFGVVYKVKDKNYPNKNYALKEIDIQNHPQYDSKKDYLERLVKNEIKNMKIVENEHSVKLIENFEYDDCTFLVMELCDCDLETEFMNYRKTTKRSYNELEVYMIMSQLNECLKKMREGKEKIIHRDLKLENILIKYDKNIPYIGFSLKVSDFGLSKKLKKEELTKTNVGTLYIQAPEIFFNKGYDTKADLWSIGIIIYQLLFKSKIPFVAYTREELSAKLKKYKRLELSDEDRKLISDECFDLLNNLLEKNPHKRIDFLPYMKIIIKK